MIDCSFCFKSCNPQKLRDVNFDPYKKGLENLCPICYEKHRTLYFKKNSMMDEYIEQWKNGKKKLNKGNASIL